MALTKVIGSGIGTVTNQFADANMAVGSVLQVVTGTTTTSTSQTSTTWADTTLTANITPSSSSSKIFILVNQSYRIQRSTYFGGGSIKILRGSTFLYYAAENTVLHIGNILIVQVQLQNLHIKHSNVLIVLLTL